MSSIFCPRAGTRAFTRLVSLWPLALVASTACIRELEVFERAGNGTMDGGRKDDAGEDAGPPSVPDAGDGSIGPAPSFEPSISAFDHTCVLRAGLLACWGANGSLQLGLGDRDVRATPQWISTTSDFVQVCAGQAHSCALRAEGALYCWGENLHGEVGVGDFEPRERPTPVGTYSFVRLACGGHVSCAIGLDGALFCWGDNFEGQIGQNDAFRSPDRATPTRVAPELSFREVSVGQGHVCAVTSSGELYCWGRNTTRQLGIPTDVEQVRTPTRVDGQDLYQSVATGQSHTCAIGRDGRLFCWGMDLFGSLGLDVASEQIVPTPTQVGTASTYRFVRASWFHTCALRLDGVLLCFGRNAEGQLGVSDSTDRNTPTRVGSDADWTEVTTGHFHTCGVRGSEVYCWGENNELNQLGLGMPGRRDTPTGVALPSP